MSPSATSSVPARTIVLASQYLIHRDERFWPARMNFFPERWLEETSNRPKFVLTFHLGKAARICIGDGFAWTEGRAYARGHGPALAVPEAVGRTSGSS